MGLSTIIGKPNQDASDHTQPSYAFKDGKAKRMGP